MRTHCRSLHFMYHIEFELYYDEVESHSAFVTTQVSSEKRGGRSFESIRSVPL